MSIINIAAWSYTDVDEETKKEISDLINKLDNREINLADCPFTFYISAKADKNPDTRITTITANLCKRTTEEK